MYIQFAKASEPDGKTVREVMLLDYSGSCERPFDLPLRENVLWKAARYADLHGEFPDGETRFRNTIWRNGAESGEALIAPAVLERVRLSCGKCHWCANQRKRRWERATTGWVEQSSLTIFGTLTFALRLEDRVRAPWGMLLHRSQRWCVVVNHGGQGSWSPRPRSLLLLRTALCRPRFRGLSSFPEPSAAGAATGGRGRSRRSRSWLEPRARFVYLCVALCAQGESCVRQRSRGGPCQGIAPLSFGTRKDSNLNRFRLWRLGSTRAIYALAADDLQLPLAGHNSSERSQR